MDDPLAIPSEKTCNYTQSGFGDERLTLAVFDDYVKRSEAFKNYKEVWGEFWQPRPDSAHNTDKGRLRIDRLIVPLAKAIKLGWRGGVIGIEAKASDHKLGPLIAQALDYSRVLFCLDERHEADGGIPGLLLAPRWIFIYPCQRIFGDLESICLQNRIGQCEITGFRESLIFHVGGSKEIEITKTGTISAKTPACGRKRGSR